MKYPIKTPPKDFKFTDKNPNAKGSRVKKFIIDSNGDKAFFKYEGNGYCVSEACSEKMSYEIAKVLGYECARIELARDEDGILGILNYLFIDIGSEEHTDAIAYLNTNEKERSQFHTIRNIKETLDSIDIELFKEFIKIMVFDALVGEQDRHEENWGITRINNKYKISPLYDNGCNLLRDFKKESFAIKFYNKIKDFDYYIMNSKTLIYKDDGTKYKHFELINHLIEEYPEYVKTEIKNLNKLTDDIIKEIVNRIPDDLLTNKHKEYIILYLQKRRNILLNIDGRGE